MKNSTEIGQLPYKVRQEKVAMLGFHNQASPFSIYNDFSHITPSASVGAMNSIRNCAEKMPGFPKLSKTQLELVKSPVAAEL